MPQRSILLLFAHPAHEKSRLNRSLVDEVRGLSGVTFHDLYEEYPDFFVDVAREQALLADHDLLVVQHPFLWYSVPPLIKQWLDLVLEHGWAYGTSGDALRGKEWLSAITLGGGETAYQPDGYARHTVRQFLAPLEQSATLCGMTFLPPFLVYGSLLMDDAAMAQHAADYRRTLEALRDGTIDLERLRGAERINGHPPGVLPDAPAAGRAS